MIEKIPTNDPVRETAEQTTARKSKQRKRSIILALVLAALVVMFYLVTLIKVGPELFSRAL